MSFITLKNKKEQEIINFKKKLFERIGDHDFKLRLEQVLRQVDFYKVKFANGGFSYKVKGIDEQFIKITVTENDICYYEETPTRINKGIYHHDVCGKIYTKYSNKETTIYPNVFKGQPNKLYDIYNITEQITFNAFDENLKEIWYLTETKDDTYYQNKKTKEKILADPDCFENYTEKNYYFREEPDLIIHRLIRNYHYPDDGHEIENEDSCLIAKNYQPDNKRIPRGGYYFGIPKEIYSGYKLGKNTQDELWNSKVKVRNIITYF